MNKKILSMMFLAIFALGIVAAAVPVRGAWGDVAVSIETPDIVVPGGGIYLSITGFPSPATGTTYFWLSKEADEEVMSGDIQIGKMASSDVEDELADTGGYITVYVPTTGVKNVTYYVKVSGSRTIGADASVSDNTIDVITENLPTITVDPTSGTVGEIVDVSGADIASDYWGEYAYLYWHTYYVDWVTSDDPVDYGEFTASDAVVPTDLYTTMGVHKILVILYDGTYYLGTFVEFEIEPSIELVDPAFPPYSIEEGGRDQGAEFLPHGFPKGTIKANTVKFVIRDIVTGALEESFVTTHEEATIDKHGSTEGLVSILCNDVDDPPAGTVDLEVTADTTKVVVEDAFVSSSSGARGDLKGKMSATEGHIGDDVTFSAIWLPAGYEVDIEFFNAAANETIWLSDDLGLIPDPVADVNGGWVWTFTIEGLPGGTYTVKLWDVESSPRASYTLGKFKVLSEVVFYDETGAEITSTHVGDEVYIEGTAFPIEASFRYITFGTGKVDLKEYVDVADDFTWSTQWSLEYPVTFPVPHTSGGGKEVTVVIKGKDAKGKAITVEATIKVKPIVGEGYIEYYDGEGSLCQYLDYDEQGEDWGWMPYTTGETIFAGHPMNITGWGFLAGEAVSVKFVDPDTGDVIGTPTITDGGTAKSNGDLEVIFQVPTGRKFKFGDTYDVHVVGTTKTNKYIVEDVTTEDLDDDYAKLFFNIQADGELDRSVNVGEEVTVIGVGFETTSLTLQEGSTSTEITDVKSSYGYFKTTLAIPTLVRGEDYYLEETVTATYSVLFNVTSAVTLSPSKAGAGTEITASGTGFAADETVDIYWPEIAEKLVEVDADSDGLFTTKFKVPVETPGTYTITFDAEELAAEDDPTATFMLIGPLKIVSLSLPTEVYNGSSVTISVTVQDYFGVAVAGATVTGSVTPPGAAAVSLTFKETATGIYTATYAVPADAKEGTYMVSVKASKPDAGGDATATGSFYVSIKLPPPPPVDITKIMEAVAAVTSDVSDLSGSVSTLSSDVKALSGSVTALSKDLADLKTKVAAIPIIPVELVYGIAIISIIAAIAAIAAVISIYRKIA